MLPISIQNANMVCVCLINPCTHLHVLDDVTKHLSQQRIHGPMSAVAGHTQGSQDVLLNGVFLHVSNETIYETLALNM